MTLPTREVGMQEVRTCQNLLHPFILHAVKGNEHHAPRTQDYLLEQPINDNWKLNVLIYTIEVLWMTLSTFFIESPPHQSARQLFPQDQEERTLVTQEKQPNPKKSKLRGIRALNKMQQAIIRITVQYVDGSPIEPEGVLSKWWNDCGVVVREKCKIVWSWDDVSKEMQETIWGFIKEHYIFPYEQEKIDKNATMKTISNALQKFRHDLNKYYVQRGLSPLNQFGYIMPNEWDTFV
jgi:hypothetical protein